MIIARFGDTWAGAYEFPTSMMVDDWATERPPVARAVGQAAGALDLRGSVVNPVRAQVVTKKFILTQYPQAVYTTVAAEGAGGIAGNLAHGNIKPGTVVVFTDSGSGYDDGAGNLYDGALNLRGKINYNTGGWYFDLFDPFEQVLGFGYQYRSGYTSPWTTLGTELDALQAATIAVGQSKLWGLLRDGTRVWTYAKCILCSAPEQIETIDHLPVTLKFWCKTGRWYSETLHTLTTDGDDILSNAGNAVAHMTATIACASTGTLSITLQNVVSLYFQTAWSGAATAGQSLVIDSAARSVKLAGAGVYSGLTRTYQNEWLGLQPGNNQIRITAGARYGAVVYTWRDTWLM